MPIIEDLTTPPVAQQCCPIFMQDGKCDDAQCTFPHPGPARRANARASRPSQAAPKGKHICRDYKRGNCQRTNCRFAHAAHAPAAAGDSNASSKRKRAPAARTTDGTSNAKRKTDKSEAPLMAHAANMTSQGQKSAMRKPLGKGGRVVRKGVTFKSVVQGPATRGSSKTVTDSTNLLEPVPFRPMRSDNSQPVIADIAADDSTLQPGNQDVDAAVVLKVNGPCATIVSPTCVGVYNTKTARVVIKCLLLDTTSVVQQGGWYECNQKLRSLSDEDATGKKDWFTANMGNMTPFTPSPIISIIPGMLEVSAALHTQLQTGWKGKYAPGWTSNALLLACLQMPFQKAASTPSTSGTLPPQLPLGYVLSESSCSAFMKMCLLHGFAKAISKFPTHNEGKLPLLDGRNVLVALRDDSTLLCPRHVLAKRCANTHNQFATGLTKMLCMFFPFLLGRTPPFQKIDDVQEASGKYPLWATHAASLHTKKLLAALQEIVNRTLNIQAGVQDPEFNGLALLRNAFGFFERARNEMLSWVVLVARPVAYAQKLVDSCEFRINGKELTTRLDHVANVFTLAPELQVKIQSVPYYVTLHSIDQTMGPLTFGAVDVKMDPASPNLREHKKLRMLAGLTVGALAFVTTKAYHRVLVPGWLLSLGKCPFGCPVDNCASPHLHTNQFCSTPLSAMVEQLFKPYEACDMPATSRSLYKGFLIRLSSLVDGNSLTSTPPLGQNPFTYFTDVDVTSKPAVPPVSAKPKQMNPPVSSTANNPAAPTAPTTNKSAALKTPTPLSPSVDANADDTAPATSGDEEHKFNIALCETCTLADGTKRALTACQKATERSPNCFWTAVETRSLDQIPCRACSKPGKATSKQTLAECLSAESRSSGCSALLLNQKNAWAIIEQGSKDASASKSIAVDLYSQFNAQAAIDALNSEPSPSSTPGQTGGKVELLSGSETESTSP